jgi:hypothetical protein
MNVPPDSSTNALYLYKIEGFEQLILCKNPLRVGTNPLRLAYVPQARRHSIQTEIRREHKYCFLSKGSKANCEKGRTKNQQ